MPNAMDLSGQRFGKLIAVRRNGTNKHKQTIWRCVCDCGGEVDTLLMILRKGQVKSCGCLHRSFIGDVARTHGMSKSPIYGIWNSMMQRCYDENSHAYDRYGGRGVQVCERWHTFEGFYADMGDRPERKSLDRVDNEGHYEPSNVLWRSAKEQNRNRRSNRLVETCGQSAAVAEFAEKYGVSQFKIYDRLNRGWCPTAAVLVAKAKPRARIKKSASSSADRP